MPKVKTRGCCEKCGAGSVALLRRAQRWLCAECAIEINKPPHGAAKIKAKD